MEKEIVFIGLRNLKSKKGDMYYIIDYVRLDTMKSCSDFISALEFTEISKKMKDKNFTRCVGIFNVNNFDKIYCSSIK